MRHFIKKKEVFLNTEFKAYVMIGWGVMGYYINVLNVYSTKQPNIADPTILSTYHIHVSAEV